LKAGDEPATVRHGSPRFAPERMERMKRARPYARPPLHCTPGREGRLCTCPFLRRFSFPVPSVHPFQGPVRWRKRPPHPFPIRSPSVLHRPPGCDRGPRGYPGAVTAEGLPELLEATQLPELPEATREPVENLWRGCGVPVQGGSAAARRPKFCTGTPQGHPQVIHSPDPHASPASKRPRGVSVENPGGPTTAGALFCPGEAPLERPTPCGVSGFRDILRFGCHVGSEGTRPPSRPRENQGPRPPFSGGASRPACHPVSKGSGGFTVRDTRPHGEGRHRSGLA
jgi:hypothetical protein